MRISLRRVFVSVVVVAQCFNHLNAQVANYIFSRSNTPYTEIAGGTVLGVATDNVFDEVLSLDDVIYNVPNGTFPFPFTFNGNTYTGCNVSTNGFLTFGATAPTNNNYNPISSSAAYSGAVSAWGRDINSVYNVNGATGEMRWEVVGTAPNREVVFQWKNFRTNFSTSTTVVYAQNFQIRLLENGNKVVVVYGKGQYFAGTTAFSGSGQIGLRGSTNTDFNNRANSTSVNFIVSTAGGTNSAAQFYNTVNATPGMPDSSLTYMWSPPAGCAGQPTAGLTQSTIADSVCSNVNFTLSLPNVTIASDLTFQWISSVDGVSYSNEAGVAKTFTSTLSTSKYFRCIVTCPTSGLSDTSSVLYLKLKSFLNCYCGAPLTGTATTGDAITKVVLINAASDSLVQTSTTNGSNNYDVYNNPPLDVQRGTNNKLYVTYGTDNTQYGAAWIDFNQNGLFEAAENIALKTTAVTGGKTDTFNFFVPMGNTGLTRMRVRGASDVAYNTAGACTSTSYGETEDYLINFTAAPPCNNPPVAGSIAAASSSVCSGDSTVITATGYDAFTSLQWQVSTDSIVWTNVAGATNPSFNTKAITSAKYYRLKVVCIDSTFSNEISIKLNLPSACYCAPTTNCSDDDVIYSVVVNNINNPSSCSATGYTLYNSFVDTMYIGEEYPVSVTVGAGGVEHTAVWVDFDQNGVFDSTEYTNLSGGTNTTLTEPFTVPANALTGNTRMRVRVRWNTTLANTDACLTYTFGETEDYSIYIQVAPPCTSAAVGGTIAGPHSGEANTNALFVLNGFTGKPTWEIALNASGPFASVNVPNDSLLLFLNAVGNFYLRAKVTIPGCVPAYSDTFALNIFQPGDEPCDAIAINFGQNGPYTMEFATASTREVRPMGGDCEAQDAWCNSTVTNSLWFKFVAPASGRVLLHAPGFDTRLALWEADTCANLADSTLGNYSLLAANDDNPNLFNYSPFIDTVECLQPGKTYYVQLAPYDELDVDTTSLFLIDAGSVDASFTGFSSDVYCVTASNETLVPATAGGVFTGLGIENDNEFNPALAGIGGPYIISHTLLGCYIFTDTVSVSGNPTIDSVAQTNVACLGDSSGALTVYVYNASQPFSYQWSNGKTTQTVGNLLAGTYTVTVISNDGCPAVSPSYIVTEPATKLVASLSKDDAYCFGGNGIATVSASGGTPTYSYLWSSGKTTVSDSALALGAFTVTVNDANSCSVVLSDTIETVATSTLVVSTVATDVTCNGATTGSVEATVSGGTPGYTYTWSNNSSTTNSISGVGGAEYSVTVTDANLCSVVAKDTVNQPSAIVASSVSAPQNGSTNGSITVTVSGGTPNYDFDWSNNATTKDITAVAGVYTLTITDANNCSLVLQDTIDLSSGLADNVSGVRKVTLYPNPTFGNATLAIETDVVQDVIVEMYDATGRLLNRMDKAVVQKENIQLNLNDYAVGIYNVCIKINGATINKQIILQR